MSNSVQKAKELLDSFDFDISTNWTIEDVLAKRDAGKASEIIRLAITEKGFETTKAGEEAAVEKSVAKKMLELRAILEKLDDSEGREEYRTFWKEMKEINDYYFLLFVKDLYQTDNTLMEKVNELRNRENSIKASELHDKQAKKEVLRAKKQALGDAVNAQIDAGIIYEPFIVAARKNNDAIEIASYSDESEASEWIESFDFGDSGYGAILTIKKDGTAAVGTRKLHTA